MWVYFLSMVSDGLIFMRLFHYYVRFLQMKTGSGRVFYVLNVFILILSGYEHFCQLSFFFWSVEHFRGV